MKMTRRTVSFAAALALACAVSGLGAGEEKHASQAVIGHSLPGTWRPFSADSPWNTPVPPSAPVHADSPRLIATMTAEAPHIRLARAYSIPVWVVNSDGVPLVRVRSDRIFDSWDQDHDGWTDVGAPLTEEMWGEGTPDGHLCIIDSAKKTAWEMSRFGRSEDGAPRCTTFNVWDLAGTGVAVPEGVRWMTRGGRGSGFPEIAGLIRPEELKAGEIRHALVFTFSQNRRAADGSQIFVPPACRSDGKVVSDAVPIEGMRVQLDPTLGERDFDRWGLTREARIVARALQRYGMFDGDNGGAMALQAQLLLPDTEGNLAAWESAFPDFYKSVERIPTDRFRVLDTGPPILKKEDPSVLKR